MRAPASSSLVLILGLFAACSGGGGSTDSSPRAAGRVQVVVDTATGTDALVQFQVVAAALETVTGNSTANLLQTPRMLTLADPMAQPDGVVLTDVPTGSYSVLRLGLVPNGGVALYPSGLSVPVSTAFELAIPFDEPLLHDVARSSWIVCGHYGQPPTAGATAPYAWSPMLRGRSSETEVALVGLDLALIERPGLTATDPRLAGAPLNLEFQSGCEFFDDHGGTYPNANAFLGASRRGDDLSARGRLHHNGRFEVDRVRRRAGHHRSRLIGRITLLEPATESFVMDVLAEARRGEHHMLPLPGEARVLAANARIERSSTRQYLPFSALAVDQLVKVEWVSRTPNASGPEEVVAHEIEVSPAGGVAMQPEWQGRVDAVDLQQRTITVVPRHNDPIIIGGLTQNPVIVNVDPGVPIERRANSGGGRVQIQLDGVVPGQDRIWWRGSVAGPAEVDATWIRVRDDS